MVSSAQSPKFVCVRQKRFLKGLLQNARHFATAPFKKLFLPHAGKFRALRARNHGFSHDEFPQGAFCNAPFDEDKEIALHIDGKLDTYRISCRNRPFLL